MKEKTRFGEWFFTDGTKKIQIMAFCEDIAEAILPLITNLKNLHYEQN